MSCSAFEQERAITKTTQQLMVMGLDRKVFWLSQILGDGCYLAVGFLVPTWITALVLDIPYLTGVCFLPFALLTMSALFSSLTASYLYVTSAPRSASQHSLAHASSWCIARANSVQQLQRSTDRRVFAPSNICRCSVCTPARCSIIIVNSAGLASCSRRQRLRRV
eukprot:COSAG06_NODE_3952_length_4727_cov_2.586646_2_plen_165_part_00